ncbi:hypothetical protein Nepgr_015864 [Nepenthes gracilis]|uniref:Uncharacterized protein n=1 Tax=Nepenthes gracilis TaxID=150966 RepID=A0AAD3XR36_NEPGR|nr:hypothetical protein Nepgr_015864 [Nepenthes gracilis]
MAKESECDSVQSHSIQSHTIHKERDTPPKPLRQNQSILMKLLVLATARFLDDFLLLRSAAYTLLSICLLSWSLILLMHAGVLTHTHCYSICMSGWSLRHWCMPLWSFLAEVIGLHGSWEHQPTKDPRGTPRIPLVGATGAASHPPHIPSSIQPKKGTPQGCAPNITSKEMVATNAQQKSWQSRIEADGDCEFRPFASGSHLLMPVPFDGGG